MVPKIVDRDKKRKDIGLAALELFSQKGFAVTSMSQVAREAGVGKGTIYEYFQSKDELISFSLKLYVEMIEEGLGNMLSGTRDPIKQLRQYTLEAMETFMKDPRTVGILLAIFQMLIADQKEAGENEVLRGMFHRARQTIIRIIAEGVSKGVFRPEAEDRAETIAINLIAYLDGIWLHSMINQRGIDLRVQVDSYLDNLIDSIVSTSAPKE